ncbi:unnamed protein product [Chondrus crispus]|uniref:Uncharacterized protein n=1 Tax=Chondrus crispus TaxID=2769 RepID=R7Q2A2_CHOCR|nr:unnamed protein product [Chondrus crispus]CDF32184.1 unnamed protein product [Chondrus crispus]|eukprot:XP_005711849.1 unnamed protein product [Chondrus crispus]
MGCKLTVPADRVAIRRIGPARSSAPRRLTLAPSHFCPWCCVHDSARLVCRVVAHFYSFKYHWCATVNSGRSMMESLRKIPVTVSPVMLVTTSFQNLHGRL